MPSSAVATVENRKAKASRTARRRLIGDDASEWNMKSKSRIYRDIQKNSLLYAPKKTGGKTDAVLGRAEMPLSAALDAVVHPRCRVWSYCRPLGK
jgi:hypothetical protein